MKFKIGDRVDYGKDRTGYVLGFKYDGCIKYAISGENSDKPYKITSASCKAITNYRVSIRRIGTTIHNVPVDEIYLKHCRVRYNRLAEKLYPNGERDGDWWILK